MSRDTGREKKAGQAGKSWGLSVPWLMAWEL